jgi:hypothetical protein
MVSFWSTSYQNIEILSEMSTSDNAFATGRDTEEAPGRTDQI